MKYNLRVVVQYFIIASVVFFMIGCIGTYSPSEAYLSVDPYIGSGGHGHVFVGASVPFGAVQVGPSNIYKGWDWSSGYHYSDSIVIGFAHTHLSGTGCTDMGDILMMPYTGAIRTRRGDQNDISNSMASFYSHNDENVEPAKYSLKMKNGVNVELTATAHAAMHRYQFPPNQEAHVIIDLVEGNGDHADSTFMQLIDEHTIEGYRYSRGWSPRHKVYFALKSEEPIASISLFHEDKLVEGREASGRIKGVISFGNSPKEAQFKVAISSVSSKNALQNIASELSSWDFESVVIEAQKLWDKELQKITIESSDQNVRSIFYTALYHSNIAPVRYSDVNGEYRGHNDKVYSDVPHTNYSTFSLWDTYRALHPLFTVIQPEKVNDMINSMLSIYDQQGKLPIWPLIGGETNQMPGYSAIPVIADAYLKGFDGFDAQRALDACISSATNPRQIGVELLMQKGYLPCDREREATSIAMEYAVGDWGIAQMAKKMGNQAVYETFADRSNWWTKYFDKTIGFIRPLKEDGNWRMPYNPIESIHTVGDFCEGNGWQYTFFAPQNPELLIELFGGDALFCAKLDEFFVTEGDMGEHASMDITGLIGQYAHGNEPSHHIAYLYTFAGEQWKTAQLVRQIMDTFYKNDPDGVIGNEDCGQMSSWYLLSSMGLYQVNPSNGVYVFGSPLLSKATISIPGEKQFIVEAMDNTPQNIYIQRVELNGAPYTKSYLHYVDIMKGGTLRFYMGNTPNKSFGAAMVDRPSSLNF